MFILLSWLAAGVCIYMAYKLLTRPQIERRHIVRNIVQMHVESEKLLNSSDRIVLMRKQLDLLNLDEIPPWQQKEYVNAVLTKFNAK